MKLPLGTFMVYFFICFITADGDYETKQALWRASKGGYRGAALLPPAPPRPRLSNFADEEFGGSVRTPARRGRGLLGLRCGAEPPSPDCSNGITMWYYDPANGTCVAHDVGNCITFGFLICRICVTTCMGFRWGDPEIENICHFQS